MVVSICINNILDDVRHNSQTIGIYLLTKLTANVSILSSLQYKSQIQTTYVVLDFRTEEDSSLESKYLQLISLVSTFQLLQIISYRLMNILFMHEKLRKLIL